MNASVTGNGVPIADLGQEYASIRAELDPLLEKVFKSGSYILGEQVQRFETALAQYIGVEHAIGVGSGTDAILLTLRALGIGPGDEVILPAMTFIATAEPVAQLGAKPVFADIRPDTYTLDPVSVEKKLSPKTKAMIVVHLYGQMADMKPLQAIARAKGIALIEDMAQAIASTYEGKKAGTFGDAACLSFYPTKNLGAFGDGGAVLTPRADLAERILQLRNHGAKIKYQHDEVGYNSRLDELQAAILTVKLNHLEKWTARRIQLADRYRALLKNAPLRLPYAAPDRNHVYHLFSICSPKRDALQQALKTRYIQTGVHYPTPLHLQKAFESLGGKKGDFPHSEQLARETLSLPLFPQMSDAAVDQVVVNLLGAL